ncbi:transcription-associated protein 1 [Blastocladiella emersonii ATCC 22665]|nr:transcription-associated protein 1 [Blastocladiella emersonii ATCC 22665]
MSTGGPAPQPPPPATAAPALAASTPAPATAMDVDPPPPTSGGGGGSAEKPEPPLPFEILFTTIIEERDDKKRYAAVDAVRDKIDVFQQLNYPQFVSKMLPAVLAVLERTPPSFESHSVQQKMRQACLEIVQKSSLVENFRPYAQQLLRLLYRTLEADNEVNGQLALKIVTELNRGFKAECEPLVQTFIDVVLHLYSNMPATVAMVFATGQPGDDQPQDLDAEPALEQAGHAGGIPGTPYSETPPMSPHMSGAASRSGSAAPSVSGGSGGKRQLLPCNQSFKVLTDCPLIVLMAIQVHREYLTANVNRLVATFLEAVMVQPVQQAEASARAREQGRWHVGMADALAPQHQAYQDLLVCQVKTLSFLAFILRFLDGPNPTHGEQIPVVTLQLMRNVPADATGARKELLVATRHIWATPFRSHFVPYMDQLLNEDIILGTGRTARETLRHVVVNMTADFLVAERARIPPAQVEHALGLFCGYLHDPTLSAVLATMCVKCIIHLEEAVRHHYGAQKNHDPAAVEAMLKRVLAAFTAKIVSLSHALKQVRHQHRVTLSPAVRVRPAKAADDHEYGSPIPRHPHDEDDDGAAAAATSAVASPATVAGTPAVAAETAAAAKDDAVVYLPDSIWEIDLDASRPLRTHLTASLTVGAAREQDLQQEKEQVRTLMRFLLGHLRQIVPFIRQCAIPASLVDKAQYVRAKDAAEVELFRSLLRSSLECFEYYWMDIPQNNMSATTQDVIFTRMGASAKEEKEILDNLSAIFVLVDPALFQEVFSSQLDYLFDCILQDTSLLAVPQFLLGIEHITQRVCSLMLGFLLERIPDLGSGDALRATILIRLFKLVFMAVTHYPELNEVVLQPHLANMIMQCIKLSATAQEPMNFFLLLRALFRSIGGGRFEHLYKEMLPLLPNMLIDLNHRLAAAHTPQLREMLVELCLTVPLRLSVLLPYLAHLMRPLVLSLQFGPDLVSQGLRTLELCLDNLTQEFLDPVMGPVSDDLMRALWRHLRPLPYNQQHAHSTMRILGKLGGRNRSRLKWSHAGVQHLDGLQLRVPVVLNNVASDVELADFVHHCLSVLDEQRGGSDGGNGNGNSNGASAGTAATADSEARVHVFKFLQYVIDQSDLQVDERILCGAIRAAHYDVEGAREYLNSLIGQFRERTQVDHFLDALVDVMTSETNGLRELGRASIIEFFKPDMASDRAAAAFRLLSFKFCSRCFRDGWYGQGGGLFGIATCVRLAIPIKWLIEHELDFIRALLYLLKSPDMAQEAPRVQDTLNQLLKICNRPDTDAESQQRFQSLISLLISELASSSALVRETVQAALRLLADLTGNDVTELLSPSRDRLLNPIFSKPLRSLPLAMQIGHTDAITYCLSLRPPLLEFNNDLLRLLSETLALADAEDQALADQTSSTTGNPSLVKLRIVCIQLLSAAMACNEFQLPKQTTTRSRIISVFFKGLYNKSQAVVDAAYKAMSQVLGHSQKLPKDLLQNGLKPILSTLADPTRLSVEALEGLGRLLELLTNYFKVEIGLKLLDHLKVIATPERLEMCAGQSLADSPDIKLMTALLSVYQKLPATANTFLPKVVDEVLRLEMLLRRNRSSPFRKPLAKYLARHPADTLDYFFQRAPTDSPTLQLFIGVLALDEAASLRNEVVANRAKFAVPGQPLTTAHCEVFYALSQLGLTIFEDADFAILPPLPAADTHTFAATDLHLVDIYLHFLRVSAAPRRADVIFKLVEWLYANPTSYLRVRTLQALHEHAMAMPWDEVDALLDRTLGSLTPECALAIRHVVLPACQLHFIRYRNKVGDVTLSPERLAQVAQASHSPMTDELILEVLQLQTCLVQYIPTQVVGVHQDLLRAAWTFIKSHELSLKHAAHVLVSALLAAYDLPSRVAYQVFGSLVKAHQQESRALVRQALDILVPVLPVRLGADFVRSVLRHMKKSVFEEGSIHQAVHVCQILVNHEDVFYPVREGLYLQLQVALPRLHIANSSNNETRLLAVDLVEVLLHWEKRRIASFSTPRKRSADEMDVDGDDEQDDAPAVGESHRTPRKRTASMSSSTAPAAPAAPSFSSVNAPPPSLKEQVITCLGRLACLLDLAPQAAGSSASRTASTADNGSKGKNGASGAAASSPPQSQGMRAMKFLRELLEIWTDSTFKHTLLEKPLLQSPLHPDNYALLERAIDLLALDLEFARRPQHASESYRLIKRVLKSDEAGVFLRPLRTYFGQMFKLDPLDAAILQDLTAHILSLFAVPELAAPAIARLPLAVSLLHTLAQRDAAAVDSFLGPLVKCLHLVTQANLAKKDSPLADNTSECLCQCIGLLNGKMHLLAVDQRRSMLSSLVLLIESSPDIAVCRYILGVCRDWVATDAVYPSLKEKSGILVKMMAFERKDKDGGTDLMDEYLRLVAAILAQKGDLSLRLEQAFLLGLRAESPSTRKLFLDILNASLSGDVVTRLEYIFGMQNWEPLAPTYYIHQALDVLLGSIEMPKPVHDVIGLLHHDKPEIAHALWIKLFTTAWGVLSPKERHDLSRLMMTLLTRDYHHHQTSLVPNVISTILEGIVRCRPLPKLAPHVIKYLGKTFNAWHAAAEFLSVAQSTLGGTKDEDRLRESTLDGLAELMLELNETDMYTGLWRRRCQYPETNAALSFQQVGLWERAQQMYEQAQSKGRTGTLGFSESEYSLWEEQWVRCCQKLQQWDVLEDVGKHEDNCEVTLEAIWRLGDWTGNGKEKGETEAMLQRINQSPRSKVFQAFVALNKLAERKELGDKARVQEFQAICDEGVQMALRTWHQLPHAVSDCHIPLFGTFQQFVELGEALQIYTSLSQTGPGNYEAKANEQKSMLATWRERLPNVWDDIDVWSDLVAWRQHIFGAINKAYYPILTTIPATAPNASAYRGYHETAWIINRFAHVARLHGLASVCIQYLPKIYTLPNIEIQEAFLKLREQAKCYLSNPAEYKTGLDVINNTNLVYFNNQQKAEFYSLKGRFLSLLGHINEAHQAFATAVTTEHNLAKPWAVWGEHQEMLLAQANNPADPNRNGKHALNCFLHTIGLVKNGKARRYVARALWLLANQDMADNQLTEVLESHKNDLAIWYWLTFIPQLLNMLADPLQSRHAKYILVRIAKMYPQSLHFLLRTLKEEVHHEAVNEIMAALKTGSPLLALSMETMVDQLITRLKPLPQEEMYRLVVVCLNEMVEHVCSTAIAKSAASAAAASAAAAAAAASHGGAPSPALGNGIAPATTNDTDAAAAATPSSSSSSLPTKSLTKLLEHFSHSESLKQYLEKFKRDFIDGEPDLMVIIDRFRIWRDGLQHELDQYRGPEHLSHYLIEFEHQRFDEVEIPGQYLKLVDSPQTFVRITRFRPEIERVRMDGNSHRRIRIVGHDGSTHAFLVQQPAPSMYRREERVVQLFGYFNTILDTAKESRKRDLQFHFPVIVPLAPNVRMISHEPSSFSLEQVWAAHCKRMGLPRDHAIMYYVTQLHERASADVPTRIALLDEIRRMFAPVDLLERFALDQVTHFTDLWMLRKQFTAQMAATCFLSFTMAIALRYPQSLHLSTTTGNIWMSEALPSVIEHKFCHYESVPFRLTPVLQHFMTPHGLDGPFSACMLAIAKALCLDGNNLTQVEDFLRVVVRDELLYWANRVQQPFPTPAALRAKVLENCTDIVGRMQKLVEDCAGPGSPDKVEPVNRHLLELVARATNPQSLAEMSVAWMPFL